MFSFLGFLLEINLGFYFTFVFVILFLLRYGYCSSETQSVESAMFDPPQSGWSPNESDTSMFSFLGFLLEINLGFYFTFVFVILFLLRYGYCSSETQSVESAMFDPPQSGWSPNESDTSMFSWTVEVACTGESFVPFIVVHMQ